MPEEEFELYLSLLSRFLRLDTGQRGEIADELRDHLEERLDELSRGGLSRADAIRAALDEFGDAAELAAHFTEIARQRRRRIIMRFSVGTVAALTAALLIGTAFWPKNAAVQLPERAIAQQDGAQPAVPQEEPAAAPSDAAPDQQSPNDNTENLYEPVRDKRTSEIEAKLDRSIPVVDFVDEPFEDVLKFLSDQSGARIIPDRIKMEQEGISPDEPVTLKLTDTPVRDVLAYVLPDLNFEYFVRAGALIVTSKEKASTVREVRIYNCRDLLNDYVPPPAPNASTKLIGVGGQSAVVTTTPPTAAEVLIKVIVSAIPEPWIENEDEGGSISEFNGLLIVSQNYQNHRKIQQLLQMIRTAHRLGPDDWAKTSASRKSRGRRTSTGFMSGRPNRAEVQPGLFDGKRSSADGDNDGDKPRQAGSKRKRSGISFGRRSDSKQPENSKDE